jgi:hypothetical protein
VLGNPPWDMQEVKDNEFFAASFPQILSVKSAKDKVAILAKIRDSVPALWRSYQEYVRLIYGQQHFMAESGRFPLSAMGRMNLYRLFLEAGHTFVRASGRVGIVLPSGFASDSFSQDHFSTLHGEGRLVSLYDFENRLGIFPGVHSSYRFCLLTVGGKGACVETDFVFFAHSTSDLADSSRHVRLSQQAVSALNPLSRTAPLLRSAQDYGLTLWMHKAGPIIGRSDGIYAWNIKPTLMFMMNAAMKGHRTAEELEAAGCRLVGNRYVHRNEIWLPFYEGKMVGMYDHRAASIRFDPTNRVRRNQPVALSNADHENPEQLALPMFWINSIDVSKRCEGLPRWCLAIKDVTSSTNERTSIAAMLAGVPLTDSLPWLRTESTASLMACLLANLNSFSFDYIARQKVAGLHLRGHYLSQLPIIGAKSYETGCPWANGASQLGAWILKRVLELTYTAWDLEPFANDCAWTGPPFRWDEYRRFLLRCELDAAFFQLYLPAEKNSGRCLFESETAEELARLKQSFPTPRDAMAYIMDTFPIVRRMDEEKYNDDYRTKRVILEIYDAMQEAIRSGQPYQTRLDPPPGPPIDANGMFVDYTEIAANPPPHIHLPRDDAKTDAELHLSDLARGFPRLPFIIRLGTQASAGRFRVAPVSTADLGVGDWVVLAAPELRLRGKAVPAAIGKLGIESRSDASSGEHYILVSVRGDAGVAQARLSEVEWKSFTSVGRIEDLC